MNVAATLNRVTPLEEPDDDGAPQSTTSTESIEIAWFPADVSENTELANIQTEVRRVFLPTGLGVTGLDSLTFDGHTWQLVGHAKPYRDPKDPSDAAEVFAEAHVKRVS